MRTIVAVAIILLNLYVAVSFGCEEKTTSCFFAIALALHYICNAESKD